MCQAEDGLVGVEVGGFVAKKDEAAKPEEKKADVKQGDSDPTATKPPEPKPNPAPTGPQ